MTSFRQTAVSDNRFTSAKFTTRGTDRMSPSPVCAISGFAHVSRIILAAFVAVVLVAVVVPGTALGAQTRNEIASFDGSGSAAGAFTGLGRVAVHQASGTVYAVDAGADAVDRFDASGTAQDFPALGTSSLDGGAVAAPDGPTTFSLGPDGEVAVDNSGTASDGNLIVVTEGQQAAWVFDSDGNYLHRITGFGYPCGAAVDSNGDVWVADLVASAITEYDAAGVPTGASVSTSGQGGGACHFAFDSSDDLYVAIYAWATWKYTAASGYTSATQIDPADTYAVAVDQGTDQVYVVHTDRVSVYDAAGVKLYDFAAGIPGASLLGVAINEAADEVHVADSANNTVRVFGAPVVVPDASTQPATDIGRTSATLNGSVNPNGLEITDCHFEYGPDTAYGDSVPCVPAAGSIPADSGAHAVSADISGLEPARTPYHFRLVVTNANGTVAGDDQTFNTAGAQITSQASRDVDVDSATVTAQVNPNGQETTYHFEYGTDSSYGQSTSESAPIGSDTTEHLASATLTGLTPGTTYHWRTVATNADGTTNGADRTFTTYSVATGSSDSCLNAKYRTGPSAALPDCRAYEMVSPVDKNGGDIKTLCDPLCVRSGMSQSSVDGSKFTYSSYKAFGDALGGSYSTQYLATRAAGGWSTHGLNPRRDVGSREQDYVFDLDTNFRAFTPDLSSAWLVNDNVTPLSPDAVRGDGMQGVPNLYRRDNTDDSYHALTTEAGARGAAFQGRSLDGRHVVFGASSGAADPGDPTPLYKLSNGELEVVSILPDGTVNPTYSMLGSRSTGSVSINNRSTVDHAISDDGSRVFWTASSPGVGEGNAQSGDLYVRLDDERTVPISTAGNAYFRMASADGSKVIFDTIEGDLGGDLYEFDVDNETRRLIAAQASGVLGASEDLSYIYFVSEENLAAGATEGEKSLYVDHDGEITFIAAQSRTDVGLRESDGFSSGAQSNVTRKPSLRSARVTPDGRRIAFQSTLSLTGYDNTDAVTGRADVEVFTYDAETQELACVSCNPSDANPVGQSLRRPMTASDEKALEEIWAAAWLPTAETSHYASRALLDDGSRVFFNSFDALVPGDTNGQQDVYQWQEQGSGSCQNPGGCVDLISSGKSAAKSEFIDASADGSDVFFETSSSLVGQDTGLVDIYDARVGGGFPPPPAPPAGCEGEGCQGASPRPSDSAPASSGPGGSGNETSRRKAVQAKVRILRKTAGATAFSLRVKVAGKGVITGTGQGLKTVRRHVAKAGTYKLTFKLTAQAKRRLVGNEVRKVRARVRFAPSAGTASQTTVVLRLKQPEQAHKTRAAKNDSGGAK